MTAQMPLRLRVVDVVEETPTARTLVLEPVAGEAPSYRAGQFLTLKVPSDRAEGAARCYSLCSAPGLDQHMAVTVKRTPQGFASNWICDNVRPGYVVEALKPSGSFTPRDVDVDLLLVAGGSGITPVMSILLTALHLGSRPVTLLYANRDADEVIFRDRLVALQHEHGARLTVVHWLEQVQGLPSTEALQGMLGPYAGREAFVCGPAPFMEAVVRALEGLGADRSRIRVERFTSLEGDPFAQRPDSAHDAPPAGAREVEVELDGTSYTLPWPADRLLLDVLLDAGLDAPYSCREGSCSACACYVREGEVALARNTLRDDRDRSEGLVLACQAVPRSAKVRISYDA